MDDISMDLSFLSSRASATATSLPTSLEHLGCEEAMQTMWNRVFKPDFADGALVEVRSVQNHQGPAKREPQSHQEASDINVPCD